MYEILFEFFEAQNGRKYGICDVTRSIAVIVKNKKSAIMRRVSERLTEIVDKDVASTWLTDSKVARSRASAWAVRG